jgi:hypothetical protein
MARYTVTYCSSCGEAFGPGDHGYSHCQNHEARRPLTAREEVAALADSKKYSIETKAGK